MQTPLTVWRWQRAEYDRLVDLDVFRGDAVELIGGQLVVAEPQGAYHASAVSTVDYALRAVASSGSWCDLIPPSVIECISLKSIFDTAAHA